MIRCFLAIALNEQVKEELAKLQKVLASQGGAIKWVAPTNIHITLKFFGHISEAQVAALSTQTKRIASSFPYFSFSLHGLGVFPSWKRPRVIWVGIEDPEKILTHLYEKLERAFSTIGFQREKKKFTPHITLGRVKSNHGIKPLIKKMQELQKQVGKDWPLQRVETLTLYQSILKTEGPIYRVLKLFPLKGSS